MHPWPTRMRRRAALRALPAASSLPFALSALLLSTWLSGCGEGQESQPGEAESQWVLSVEPAVTIGGSDEREDYLLHGVADATRLSDGRIVVANGGSSEILFYDASGQYLETAGGAGEGPGEFLGLLQLLRLPGDTLLVFSFRPGLTWLSPEGDYVRSQPFSLMSLERLPCRIAEANWSVLPDATLLTVLEDNLGTSGCPPAPEEPWRTTGLVARVDPQAAGRHPGVSPGASTFDTLAILPATERNSPNYRAYGRSLVLSFGPDRIYAGDTGADEILALGFEGDTLQRYRTPFEPVPIPPAARAEEVRRTIRPDGSVAIGQPYDYPAHYPLFGRLLADAQGDLWVMAYPELQEPVSSWRLSRVISFVVGEAGARWRVLAPDGALVAEIQTPPRFFPLEIGEDYVLGVAKDELDVEAVQLYRLER